MSDLNQTSPPPHRPSASRQPSLNRVDQALGAGAPLVLQLFSKTGNACKGYLLTAFRQTFGPVIQFLRPVSPLAGLPLGLVLFHGAGQQASEVGAHFIITIGVVGFGIGRPMSLVECPFQTA